MYVRGGYNVYPMEVEAVLATHPAVAEIAVVARSDDVMGEIGVAVVVPVRGAAAPTPRRAPHARRELAHHKLPEPARPRRASAHTGREDRSTRLSHQYSD